MESINIKKLNLSPSEEIQFIYPDEPEWSEVSDETLITLIKDYESEPNCATIALGHLNLRKASQANKLATWLLNQDSADEWLKASAQDIIDDS